MLSFFKGMTSATDTLLPGFQQYKRAASFSFGTTRTSVVLALGQFEIPGGKHKNCLLMKTDMVI